MRHLLPHPRGLEVPGRTLVARNRAHLGVTSLAALVLVASGGVATWDVASAGEQRARFVGPPIKSIEPSAKWGVDHRDRFPVFNDIQARPPAAKEIVKRRTKSTGSTLLGRWLELHEAVRGWSVRAEPFEDRTLEQLFPNTEFYKLTARTGGLEAVRYGCASLGEPLVLPEDINLLLVLENRRVSVHNARSLAEVLVRMADPEGATTMNVVSQSLRRNRGSGEIDEVEIVTWSYNEGLRKRWTLTINEPYFHSLAEKVVAYRPPVLDGLRPLSGTFLDEGEFRGADEGDETYIVFWRSPQERNRVRAVREAWLERLPEALERIPPDE